VRVEVSGPDADQPVLGRLGGAVVCLSEALDDQVWRLGDDQLGTLLDQLGQLRRDTARLLTAAVTEATSRSAPDREGHSSTGDYLRAHLGDGAGGMDPTAAHRTGSVATGCRDPRHQPLAKAVEAGRVRVDQAARVLRVLEQIQPYLDPDSYTACQDDLITTCTGGASDRVLRRVLRDLVDEHKPVDSDELEKAQKRNRGLYERTSTGGTTEFVWRLDPEGAAFVRAAIGPLAKPVPDEDGPDPRSPQQRRSDALMAIVQRGMTSPGAAPTTNNAKVFITLSLQQLVGELSGLGCTLTGEQLTAAAVRRLACQADLVPVVLDTAGHVLDLGHTARLASPAQRAALWLEEPECTYQGCTMPGQWCIAHHAIWWSRGGATDHDNLHLLCPRHHTKVHEHDLHYVKDPDGTPAWRY
jgi:hypothetical protein